MLRTLLADAVTEMTSVDGKVIRTFRRLLFAPGLLTSDFLMGKRKVYVAALPLFLLANVLFFATQSISPVKVFSSPLNSHLQQQDWKGVAQSLVQHKLDADNQTLVSYAPVFDRAVAVNAKSLVILMVVPLLALLPLLFWRARRPYVFHVVFALHLYAFNLVLLSALLLVSAGGAWISSEDAMNSSLVDHAMFAVYLIGTAIYAATAIRVAYAASGICQMSNALVLTAIAAITVVGYRFSLLLITLYGT
jgi:hypothetical protein